MPLPLGGRESIPFSIHSLLVGVSVWTCAAQLENFFFVDILEYPVTIVHYFPNLFNLL